MTEDHSLIEEQPATPQEVQPAHEQRRHGRDLTVGSIPRHLVAFSLPMLAGSALQTAYSFINAIWVGQQLGVSAMAAVTVSFPVVFVLMALGGGLTMATNILIAQYFGARDMAQVRKVVNNSVLLVLGVSVLLVIIGEIFAWQIIRVMNTPPEVIESAARYLQIFLIALPFAFGVFLISSMLRGIGDSTTPLYFQTASVALAVILDPVLMFGWLGFPRLGLNGTAWATVITQAGAVVAVFIYMQRRRSPVSPSWTRLNLDWHIMWKTVKIGMPAAIQQSLVSVGMIFVVGMVNGFGKNATAAFGAAMRIDQLAFMPSMTMSMAVSTLAGQNIGAGKMHRVKEIFRWGVLISAGITAVASVLAVTVPHWLLRIFVHDPEVIGLGVEYLRIVGVGYLFFAVMFVSNGIINGAGHTLVTTIISLVSLWVFRVPIAYYLSAHLHNVRGVWYAILISFAAALAVSLIYYYSGRWQQSMVIRRQPPADPVALLGEETGEI
ncbi:MAG: MATE family efflux transporter [Armatimonadota bacterium]